MKRRIIKLAPQVSAWCDAKNNIYLSSNGRREKELKNDIDMKAINKGIKAGLIILEEHNIAEKKEVKKVEVPKEEPVAIEVKAQPEPKAIADKVKAKRAAKKEVEPEEVKQVEDEKDKEE